MEKFFQEHIARIDRLMKIIEADNPYKMKGDLSFEDIIIFTCQSMWHLKDWILNDQHFGAEDIVALNQEIHSTRCLLVCSDIANGTKHLSLKHTKTGSSLSEVTGIHVNIKNDIYKEFYYIFCNDPKDEFHGMEVRMLLRRCRDSWESIINKHYLSGLINLD